MERVAVSANPIEKSHLDWTIPLSKIALLSCSLFAMPWILTKASRHARSLSELVVDFQSILSITTHLHLHAKFDWLAFVLSKCFHLFRMEIIYSEEHSAMFMEQMLYRLKFLKYFITELILTNNKNGQRQTQILVTLLSWNTAHYTSGPLKPARLLLEQSDSKSQ